MPHPADLKSVDAQPPAEPVIGIREVGDVAAYVRAALRRRRRLVVVVSLVGITLVAAVLVSVPRLYTAQARILAMTDYQMPALANPHRTIPMYGDDPTRAAAPMLLSENNLEWVVSAAELERRFKASRTPLLRLKDQLHDLVLGPLTPAEEQDALVKLLRKHLGVTAGKNVIDIYVTWYDPETTALIARLLTDRFLEQRRAREVSGITDTLAVLESHATQQKARVDAGLITLRKLRQAREKQTTRVVAPVFRTRRVSRAASAELTRVTGDLAAKQQAIAAVEATRAGRLASLRATLREKSTILAPGHPDIVELKASIQALERPSPELAQLKADAARLRQRYDQLRRSGAATGPSATDLAHRAVELARNEVAEGDPSEAQDPDIASARSQLLDALDAYDDLLGRVSAATIELDVANAAFKYRYSVTRPPKVPKEADKPNVPLVLGFGIFASVAIALGFGLGLEILGQKILLPWQVERQIHLPYLGGVKER